MALNKLQEEFVTIHNNLESSSKLRLPHLLDLAVHTLKSLTKGSGRRRLRGEQNGQTGGWESMVSRNGRSLSWTLASDDDGHSKGEPDDQSREPSDLRSHSSEPPWLLRSSVTTGDMGSLLEICKMALFGPTDEGSKMTSSTRFTVLCISSIYDRVFVVCPHGYL